MRGTSLEPNGIDLSCDEYINWLQQDHESHGFKGKSSSRGMFDAE